MSGRVLVLRPEPGAGRTAGRARTLGLEPIVAPLFTVEPLSWEVPDPAAFDALLLTSANAAREAGDGLTSLRCLPCFAVGDATAVAAREAGLDVAGTGSSDGGALLKLMEAEGVRSALHLCGREHRLPENHDIAVTSIPVYAAEATDRLGAKAEAAIAAGGIVLLHSPRAGALFSELFTGKREGVRIAAISAAAARSAGSGWADVAVAAEPRDQALLDAAAKLCQRGG